MEHMNLDATPYLLDNLFSQTPEAEAAALRRM
jgi:hypothetical protein